MSARALLLELERRLADRAAPAAAFDHGLDFAVIERVYGIGPDARGVPAVTAARGCSGYLPQIEA